MRIFLCTLSVLVVSSSAIAGSFKFRAREHYEIHKLSTTAQDYDFKGFSNTINAWIEEPYKYAYGLSISPLLAGIKSDEPYPIGRKINLYAVGFEGKYFPKTILDYIYFRGGVGYAHLRSGGLGKKDGFYLYSGLGYEIPFRTFGIAIEVAYRFVELNDNISDRIFTPSIGFHFYEMF